MLLIRLGKISQLYGLWGRTLISSRSSFLSLSLCLIAFSDRVRDSLSVMLAAQDLSCRMTLVLFSGEINGVFSSTFMNPHQCIEYGFLVRRDCLRSNTLSGCTSISINIVYCSTLPLVFL